LRLIDSCSFQMFPIVISIAVEDRHGKISLAQMFINDLNDGFHC